MAHAPEHVEQYVCVNCQVTYAGSVTREDGERHFHPPDDCPVCGDPDFVQLGSYVHRALEGST
jgi:rubrerythrin